MFALVSALGTAHAAPPPATTSARSGAVPAPSSRGEPAPAEAYAEECGSCHVPYPARLLAAAQWFAVLSALDEHYGVDATVDSGTLARVARHLGVVGGVPHADAVARESGPRPTAALPRITTQPWFVREHREAQKDPRAGVRMSQCDACHDGAARGDFEEAEHGRR